MSDCCTPKGYRWIFSERSARAEAKRYRRKGLDATSRRIFDFVKKQGVEGRTVLEVGGGIGAIQIELLKAGAGSDHAREMLVMSVPKRTWWTRIAMLLGNTILRATRREFHIFLHPPKSILATSEQHGLRTVLNDSGVLWTVAA